MTDILSDTKLAVELEKKGYDFYSKAAAKTNNPLAKATLSGLAEREKEHLEKISELFNKLSEARIDLDWLRNIQLPTEKGELLSPILNKLKDSLNRSFESEQSINDAYQIAKDLERDSFNLYDKISRESDDKLIKDFYAALAQEEKQHYAILEDTLQYLENPAEWFKKEERWIVEG